MYIALEIMQFYSNKHMHYLMVSSFGNNKIAHNQVCEKIIFNFDSETELSHGNLAHTMAAHALALCVPKSTAAMILPLHLWDRDVSGLS